MKRINKIIIDTICFLLLTVLLTIGSSTYHKANALNLSTDSITTYDPSLETSVGTFDLDIE